jgi:hypothetical protein
MQVAVASVKRGLNANPSASKKLIEHCTSLTGMLTNSLRGVAGSVRAFVITGVALVIALVADIVVSCVWVRVIWAMDQVCNDPAYR